MGLPGQSGGEKTNGLSENEKKWRKRGTRKMKGENEGKRGTEKKILKEIRKKRK